MNYIRKAHLIERLTNLLRDGAHYSEANMGICEQLNKLDMYYSQYKALKAAMRTWEHYSGYEYYPVPSSAPHAWDARAYYHRWDNLWEGNQLMLRRSLLRHMIREVETWDV